MFSKSSIRESISCFWFAVSFYTLFWTAWFAYLFPGIMRDFYVRVTILVTGLCFVETVTTPSRKSSVSFNPEYQRNGDLLVNWSSIRHVSQNTDAMDRSFYFFRVLFQPHTQKERHIKPPDRTHHRISKVTLDPLAHLHALEILNLSNKAIHYFSLDQPLPPSSHQKRHGGHSHSRLPRLQVLILQRNQLSGTPKGEQCERIHETEKEYVGHGCFMSTRVLCLCSVTRERLKKQSGDRANTIKARGTAYQSGTFN